jgi:hypothetical protein
MEAVVGNDSDSNELPEAPRSGQIRPGERHPLFGALKGFTRIPPGVDLTEPADPDWGKVYSDDGLDE